MFENIRLVILFDVFLNLSFKVTVRFTSIAATTANTSKFIYTRKDFKSSGTGSLYEK